MGYTLSKVRFISQKRSCHKIDTKTVQLTKTQDLEARYKQIYGAVAFPGKRPGFAVMVGMIHEEHFESHDIYLLDGFESADMRELIRQCGVLDYKYKPELWIGDRLNDAADRFIREMNEEFKSSRRRFTLSSTQILDMKQPYSYILPELKRMLNKDHRQLFLEDSKVVDDLGIIEPSQIPEIEFGDFPAVEALAFAVIEMRGRGKGMTADEAKEIWNKHIKPY